jgi:hypothetical protein
MKNVVLLLIAIISAFISAEALGLENTKETPPSIVVGEGEYIVQEFDTLGGAYLKAENLAKVDASKKVGQYFEVVNLTDSSTKERKEVVTSIAASISSYTIKSKDLVTINEQIIVKVVVEASASRTQLDKALKRYLSSAEYKAEILKLKNNTALLELAIQSKDEIIAQLSSISEKNIDTSKIKKKLYFVNKEISDLSVLFGASISKAHRLSEFIDGEQVADEAKQLENQTKLADPEYVRRLSDILDQFHYGMNVNKVIDPTRGVVDIMVYPQWDAMYWDLARSLLPDLDVDGNWKEPLDDSGTRIVAFQLDLSPFALVARKYSVIYVVNVNGEKREFPILMPLEVSTKRNYSEVRTFPRTKFGRSRCSWGQAIAGDTTKEDVLCFNYKFNSGSVHYSRFINSNRRDSNTLVFNIPIGEDSVVDTYFEIREVSTQESVYKKRFN